MVRKCITSNTKLSMRLAGGIYMGAESKKVNTINASDINKIKEFLETIQFGSVTVIIQDGKVIQIEKNEKVRMK